ncbi:hypothetical protein MDUV_06850 [Mycolicibacterium duvalii]|uniref:Uncharacterized protein n=1 Tax=Mycolicibacterium duvalii TaxID=39688 RepID=A0A7I7JVE7_9MYCO|nr:hypothetical protein MDUV_06850 [Mycolicibacterium duvalii]
MPVYIRAAPVYSGTGTRFPGRLFLNGRSGRSSARPQLPQPTAYRGARHIGQMGGPSSGILISPVTSNPNRM